MSLVRKATCWTPAPSCQARKSSIWPARRVRSGCRIVNVTPPDGLCTTLDIMPWSPTSMYSWNVTVKPNTCSWKAIVASSSPAGTHTAAWSMMRSRSSFAPSAAPAARHEPHRVVDDAQQVVLRPVGGARLHLDRAGLELGARAAAFDEPVDH